MKTRQLAIMLAALACTGLSFGQNLNDALNSASSGRTATDGRSYNRNNGNQQNNTATPANTGQTGGSRNGRQNNRPSAESVLTGDPKLACEAILCLSSGKRPTECAPSLNRYFSIRHRKLHQTLNARTDFLRLCPSSNEDNMPELIDAIANGAGRCNAAALNRINRATYTKRVWVGTQRDGGWQEVKVPYIRNAKPSYCQAYHQHQWTTSGERVHYVGDERNGGRWVDR